MASDGERGWFDALAYSIGRALGWEDAPGPRLLPGYAWGPDGQPVPIESLAPGESYPAPGMQWQQYEAEGGPGVLEATGSAVGGAVGDVARGIASGLGPVGVTVLIVAGVAVAAWALRPALARVAS